MVLFGGELADFMRIDVGKVEMYGMLVWPEIPSSYIQYYSMISSWLVKLNCIPIYMLSCELT